MQRLHFGGTETAPHDTARLFCRDAWICYAQHLHEIFKPQVVARVESPTRCSQQALK